MARSSSTNRGARVRSWNRGKAGKTIWVRADGAEQDVVRLSCHRNRRGGLARLTARLIVRNDLNVDAGGIHCGNAHIAEIE